MRKCSRIPLVLLLAGASARAGIDSGGDAGSSGFSIGGSIGTAVPATSRGVPGVVPTLFPAAPLPDGDGDGMPDGWEIDHGLDPDVADGHEDPDGDGADSRSEYVAGTDPRSRSSYFSLAVPERTGSGWSFSFHGVVGRSYRLWSSDSLRPGSWLLEAEASGGGSTITLEVPSRPGSRRFHVLEARIP
ncbi:hypothetical protein [Luteolibacter marinus]|uniref:hypothetical protein n=1 Tax=Luteolibacter marinus TaxID=2776705 RepID=UPI001868DDE6|nr:hypothetical protein [Luteolibacter marinus]